jgi:hypothetical protein
MFICFIPVLPIVHVLVEVFPIVDVLVEELQLVTQFRFHPVAGGHSNTGAWSCSQILGSNSEKIPNRNQSHNYFENLHSK